MIGVRLRCWFGLHRWRTAYVHGACKHQGCPDCGRQRYLPVATR